MRTTAILASLAAEPRASKSPCEDSGEFPGCITPWRKCMRWCIALAISMLALSAAAFDATGGEPSITIVSPQSTVGLISTPVRIEVSFDTSPDARIVPDTFKVLYGAFRIDVTSKIRPYAVVSEHGFLAEKAVLPPGTHRLFLQISDSVGRTAESEVKISVAK
jgi:hypothetical protein